MRTHLLTVILLALITWPVQVLADEPPARPFTHEIASGDGLILVISSPDRGTRVIERGTGRELWTLPGWFRWLFVANDGEHLATGYDGMNLIPIDAPDDLVLLTLWERGEEIRQVTLKEIVPDRSLLVRTVSHYHWGTIEGFDDRGDLVVHRCDGKIVRFDVSTGAVGKTR